LLTQLRYIVTPAARLKAVKLLLTFGRNFYGSILDGIMRLLLILSAVVAVVTAKKSGGCDKPIPEGVRPGESADLTINSESGVTPRRYRLHIPEPYEESTPIPLILSFHGRGKTGKYQEALSQFSNATYGFEGIAVYPEGIPVRN
jgi:poly(3-hydroxybutyrate) depolymerase